MADEMKKNYSSARLMDGKRFLAPFTVPGVVEIIIGTEEIGHATAAIGSFAETQDPANALVVIAGNVWTAGTGASLSLAHWESSSQSWVTHGSPVEMADTGGTWQDFAFGIADPDFPLERKLYAIRATKGVGVFKIRGVTSSLLALS